jgi:hypothetical protein
MFNSLTNGTGVNECPEEDFGDLFGRECGERERSLERISNSSNTFTMSSQNEASPKILLVLRSLAVKRATMIMRQQHKLSLSVT